MGASEGARNRTRTAARVLVALAVAIGALLAPPAAMAAIITVTQEDDDGDPGTLRWAITSANSNSNPSDVDAIHFDESVDEVLLTSPLTVTEPLAVDGCSGALFAFNPCVAIRRDPTVLPSFDGLGFGAPNSSVQRVAMTGFRSAVVQEDGADNLVVQRSWFGARPGLGGAIVGSNRRSLLLRGDDAEIGGTTGAGNVIVASFAGVEIRGSSASVSANLIGALLDGTAAGNDIGVNVRQGSITEPATDNTIGGADAARANVISNSSFEAIRLGTSSEDLRNQVLRNTGMGNGGPFIDVGGDGPGNDPTLGPNDGIQAPVIAAATNQSVSGSGARPLAIIRVFRRGVDQPGRIDAFVGLTAASLSGTWQLNFPTLPGSGFLVATQTTAPGTSELSNSAPYRAPATGGAAAAGALASADPACAELRKKLRKAKRAKRKAQRKARQSRRVGNLAAARKEVRKAKRAKRKVRKLRRRVRGLAC